MVIARNSILLAALDRLVECVLAIALERLIMIELGKEIAHIALKLMENRDDIPRSLSVVSNVCNLSGGLLNR